ncbi:Enoyl-CoA delta isomerase 1, mitochondrial [Liparis tanakae]|uniref:Enoyl-CoA delta isomerase 1, mitochondrial n=1 Tax=Liparis tanakae TaxID=230148 RepID=A0A4Z2H6S3_9TELE|nr:Enoyl-CoA delta isomerase 1, mitochondrial [Liparis tanakae]
MMNTVGHRTTEVALQLGLLYNPSEALKIGLVDQLVPEDQVLATATQTMTKWLAIPDHARALTKSMMRKPTIDKLTSDREADIQHFVNFITKDSIQKSLGICGSEDSASSSLANQLHLHRTVAEIQVHHEVVDLSTAGSNIGHHVVEGIGLLHGRVWRGVLGDQNKVPHSYEIGGRIDLLINEAIDITGGLPVCLEVNMTTKGSRMKVSVPHGSQPSS